MSVRILAVLLTLTMISAADAAKVSVRTPVLVKANAMIRLGDIASITGASKQDVERLAAVEVATAPPPGLSRSIDLQYVKIRIKSTYGDPAKLVIDAPAKVVVTGRCMTVKGEDLKAAARDYLLASLPVDNKRYEVEINRCPSDAVIPEGKMELQLDTPRVTGVTGPRSVGISILVDGKQKTRISVFAEVKAFAEVLVAKTSIPQKTAVSESNTSWEVRDVSRLRSPLTKDFDTSAVVAARSIQAGTVITQDMVTGPSAVENGSPVTIVVQSSSIRLCAKGTAVQSGKAGDTIRVRGPFGAGELRATVLEPGIVEVRI